MLSLAKQLLLASTLMVGGYELTFASSDLTNNTTTSPLNILLNGQAIQNDVLLSPVITSTVMVDDDQWGDVVDTQVETPANSLSGSQSQSPQNSFGAVFSPNFQAEIAAATSSQMHDDNAHQDSIHQDYQRQDGEYQGGEYNIGEENTNNNSDVVLFHGVQNLSNNDPEEDLTQRALLQIFYDRTQEIMDLFNQRISNLEGLVIRLAGGSDDPLGNYLDQAADPISSGQSAVNSTQTTPREQLARYRSFENDGERLDQGTQTSSSDGEERPASPESQAYEADFISEADSEADDEKESEISEDPINAELEAELEASLGEDPETNMAGSFLIDVSDLETLRKQQQSWTAEELTKHAITASYDDQSSKSPSQRGESGAEECTEERSGSNNRGNLPESDSPSNQLNPLLAAGLRIPTLERSLTIIPIPQQVSVESLARSLADSLAASLEGITSQFEPDLQFDDSQMFKDMFRDLPQLNQESLASPSFIFSRHSSLAADSPIISSPTISSSAIVKAIPIEDNPEEPSEPSLGAYYDHAKQD